MKPPTYPPVVENLHRIKLSDLIRSGFLQPNSQKSGTLNWKSDGKTTGSIDVFVDTVNAEMTLSYRLNSRKSISYTIELINKPNGYGCGWYFLCPKSNSLCRVQYLWNGCFVSRRAIPNIHYQNQTESKKWRSFGKLFDDEKMQVPRNAKLYYAGKPTRRLKRIQRAERNCEKGVWAMKNIFGS
jgi:hypothetical protein